MTRDYTMQVFLYATHPRETTSLVKPLRPKFYPQAKIFLQHNQLKQLISTRDVDTIYYSSGFEIYALQTKSKKCELVKSLPWEPKCLDAAHGWICAAADRGQCVFIQIASDQDGQPWLGQRQYGAEVDELLQLDLDPASRSLASREVHRSASTNRRTTRYSSYNHVLGDDIVNSVAIHKMQSVRKGLEDEIVVILTSNDRHVRIFSLSQSKPLVTLKYSVAMNHATMSPDSNLLLAVGDQGKAFFHRRILFENPTVVGDKTFSTSGWIALAEPLLPQIDYQDNCFCTGFSPSGERCVVASESGTIVVYDTSLITDEMERGDAVVRVMKTSRPAVAPEFIGAARSMSFSPSPWDLLVIGEDQGRVTVLDVRSPEFMFRQTLDLSTDPEDVTTTEISEVQDYLQQVSNEIEQDLLRDAVARETHLNAMTNDTDNSEQTASLRQDEGDMLNSEVQALAHTAGRLTESQRRIIESIGLRYARANNAATSSSISAPDSVNYTTTSRNRDDAVSLPSAQRPLSAAPGFRAADENSPPSTSSTNQAPAGRDYQMARTASIAEYVHQRNIERERQRTFDRQPRRRSSVVISTSSNRNNQNNPATLAPIGTSTPTLSASPSRLPSGTSSNTPSAPPTNPNDTTPPSRTASSLTIPEYWPTPEDWRTASIEATSTNRNDDQSRDRPYLENNELMSRLRREVAAATAPRRTTSDLRPANSPPTTTLPDPRLYQQPLQSLLARTEVTRNELARVENELARNRMAGLDAVRTGVERMDRVAGRVRDLNTTSMQQTRDGLRAAAASGLPPQSRAGGVVTQGVGWSQDGRSLFVATEVGLLEYEVNLRERMQWPGVGFL